MSAQRLQRIQEILARAMTVPFAHRGLFVPSLAPENSLAAFRAALDNGFGMECDVHVTSDDRVIVFHDDALERLTNGAGQVADMRWSHLSSICLQGTSEHIPLLEDLLALVGQHMPTLPLVIELKSFGKAGWDRSGRLERATLRALQGYGGDALLKSFNPFSVQLLLDLQSDWPVGQLACQMHTDGDFGYLRAEDAKILSTLASATARQAHFVSYGINDLNETLRHDPELQFKPWMSWTIRTREQLEKAKELGCQLVFERSVLEEVIKQRGSSH
jgi:glycerophosphoryl diester phosphodiesterase